MLRLWRYLSGYVKIRLSGENAEKILNCAAKNRINIWDLRCRKGYITGCISIKNFIRLRSLKRGIGCKIKIIEKRGIVFKSRKYINRTGRVIGVVLFFTVLQLLSQFVWIINIEGNINLQDKEILHSCKSVGISEGIFKSRIDSKYAAQRLLLEQEGIAWASVNLEGCVVTVNLTEAKTSDKEDREEVSNIKAGCEGKILKINVSSGKVMTRVGDIVSIGDILVSGIVDDTSVAKLVHSEGEIIAETHRTFIAKGKFTAKEKIPTGRIKKRSCLEIFKLKIPLYLGSVKDNFEYTDSIKQLKLFGKNIPIRIAKEKYRFFEFKNVEYDNKELENLLQNNIEKQLKECKVINSKILDKKIENSDEGITMTVEYLCEENIAVQDKILLNTEN